ncbi:bifunctional metallophosphatase/5'-nucleotidase [Marinoscillum sp.]|uniref:bifunctional metallophosphatase/5'-nucleotidase n=1 Tax=Marinoscillum sp. TaxID=2024838 RepID=UPI003BAD54B7
MKKLLLLFLILLVTSSCKDNEPTNEPTAEESINADTLAIYFINDQHGQLDNFAKIKHIVDSERANNQHVLLVCAGDMFSGNPIVDQYEQKGLPMIDVMNKAGFDVSVLGNHEFDYGPENLKNRMNQAEFAWVCANVDMQESGVPQPPAFVTMDVGDLKVTFLGLVETFGKPGAVIPATHPWRVEKMKFTRHTEVLDNFRNLKSEEEADLLIALTHLGTSIDTELAENYPIFDAIIGGHSHQYVDMDVDGIPIVQASSYLQWLGRLQFIISDDKVISESVSFTNLDDYGQVDAALKSTIDSYNNTPQFDEVVGYSNSYLDRTELGCFYTTALKEYMDVDASFQNSGGIRSEIDQGDITALEIYNMDPFNNGSVVFTLTALEVKQFFMQTGAGLHVSGLEFERNGQDLTVYDEAGNAYADDDLVTIGINDYIPAVHDTYFPLEKAEIKNYTTAEAIIGYLQTINSTVDEEGCNQYFSY